MNRRDFIQSGAVFLVAEQKPQQKTYPLEWGHADAPDVYAYEPQKDITLWEMASLIPVFTLANSQGKWDYFSGTVKVSPELMRHFRKT